MREIKFRAWDSNERDSYRMKYNLSLNSAYFRQETLKGIEVMQFTGLLDKNGKEIYEGDIVHVWEHNVDDKGVIRYDESHTAFVTGKYGCTVGEFQNIEILGNIYENPDLIN